jgi:transcription elongation factor GreA
MSSFPVTKEGFSRIETELKKLKEVDRPTVIQAIGDAREHGDLKENAEYHSAREKQGFIEARIGYLEDKVARAQIIDVSKITGTKIKFGARVTLCNLADDSIVTYTLTSEYEADLTKGLLSTSSPIAMGLLGKDEGEEAKIQTPK